MASSINIAVYSDALVVLGTAGIVVPMVHRWGINPVLGYLAAGVILGPMGLGTFVNEIPLLYWLTVVDSKNVSVIADLGVVFLLFLIGLELSYERLMAMRRLVFGLGGLQVAITTALIGGGLIVAGQKPGVGIFIAACLALSSTAIVLEVLSRQGRLTTTTGRTAFAVLLAQDLAVIPILIFVSVLGANKGSSVFETASTALFHAVVAIAFIVIVGRLLLRPLFRQVVRTQSSELFIATILFVIVATGVIAAVADLSMALGAFVAGLLLAETEYRKAIEATIEPFKGLLLGIFFFTVGMGLDPREIAREPLLILGCLVGLVGLKAGVIIALTRWHQVTWPASVEIGLLLGPGGEFAFVGIGLATTLGVVERGQAGFILAVTSLSMVFIPLMPAIARRLKPMLTGPREVDPVLALKPEPLAKHAIVVGHGRVGKVVCGLLDRHGIAYTAIDSNPNSISHDRAAGDVVYYGDASNTAFLNVCGLADAAGIIVTIHSQHKIDEIVRAVRDVRHDILIIARARDAEHARHLYALGVTDAVPETIEASLQLSEAALVGLGVPSGPVIASIHERRDEFRTMLQQAASAARPGESHAIRAKTMPAPKKNTG